MVDYFSIALTHGLLALVAWRLLLRGDLDREPPPEAGPDAAAKPAAAKPVKTRKVQLMVKWPGSNA